MLKKLKGLITFIDSRVKLKKIKYFTKELKTKTQNKMERHQNKIRGKISFHF